MSDSVYQSISERKSRGQKSLALLIDPDKVNKDNLARLVNYAVESKVDYLFVGGSLISNSDLDELILQIKDLCTLPTIIFPGSNLHISKNADAILLLSLISGRNADLLIGQHVEAAPVLRKSGLELLSTGYLLVDGGRATTVSYISNTQPIPADKPEIAACTAMAGEMIGMRLIYLDAGSGALNSVPEQVIENVNKSINVPLIVGGGIRTTNEVTAKLKAGADIVVIGNQVEEHPEFLVEAAEIIQDWNSLNIHK